jgi:tetratricopeptide (TPR) repeat protein
MFKKFVFVIGLFVMLSASSGWTQNSQNSPGEALLADAQTLYAGRENIAKVADLIALFEKSLSVVDAAEPEVQFQLRMLQGHALYFKAMHLDSGSKEEKMAIMEQAMSLYNKAKTSKDYAEAYFWYAAALGRWAETKGILESLGRKDELIKELNTALKRKTAKGLDGETVDGYGPKRVLGRLYAKLPFFAGGSRSKAKENLEYAYSKAPLFTTNVIYRAELFASGTAAEKTEACKSLENILKEDPRRLDPDRIPENTEDFMVLAKLKNQICN